MKDSARMSSKKKTTATKEDGKPALVPKLRFPEFRDADGWEYSPLGKLLMKSPDYGVNAAAVPFNEMLPKYLRITDISEDGTYLSDKKVSVDLEPTEEIYLDEGDIVLARTGASVGKSYRYRKEDGRLVFAGFLIRVKPNPKRLEPTYLANFLTTEQYWKWVAATSARSGQPGINSVEYSSLAIPLPAEFPEQQKIAECLSSVDASVAAQARKVDALKTHKKGLMQQLFPREGETQPRLRFPEFQNAAEWEDGELGPKTNKVGSGITPTGGDKNYKQAGRPFVRSQNVGWGILLLDEIAYIDEATHASFDSTEIKVTDVLLNITGASIGRSAVSDERIVRGNVNQHVCIIRVKPDELNPFFLNQFLISQRGQKQIDSFQAGGNRQGLNFAQIRSFAIPLPPKLPEQQRIADCLTSLDDLIAAETQKLAGLKTHKKGLMQQLFPSPEEVQA